VCGGKFSAKKTQHVNTVGVQTSSFIKLMICPAVKNSLSGSTLGKIYVSSSFFLEALCIHYMYI